MIQSVDKKGLIGGPHFLGILKLFIFSLIKLLKNLSQSSDQQRMIAFMRLTEDDVELNITPGNPKKICK